MFIRTIVGIFGGLLVAAGVFGIFSGCVLISTNRNGGGSALVFGLAALLIGWLIIHASDRKTCPQCAEKVKYEAKKCKHCGHMFDRPAPDPARASLPE